jgi:hypothetical protein
VRALIVQHYQGGSLDIWQAIKQPKPPHFHAAKSVHALPCPASKMPPGALASARTDVRSPIRWFCVQAVQCLPAALVHAA